MIRVDSRPTAYRSIARSADHEILVDAPVSKGGGGAGFGAHDLLEASLAACINMAVRMYDAQHAMPLERVSTTVRLSWPDAQTSRFDYTLTMDDNLTADDQRELHAVAERCPIRQTLSKQLVFEPAPTIERRPQGAQPAAGSTETR